MVNKVINYYPNIFYSKTKIYQSAKNENIAERYKPKKEYELYSSDGKKYAKYENTFDCLV